MTSRTVSSRIFWKSSSTISFLTLSSSLRMPSCDEDHPLARSRVFTSWRSVPWIFSASVSGKDCGMLCDGCGCFGKWDV